MKFFIVFFQCWLLIISPLWASGTTPHTELKLLGWTQTTITDPDLSAAEWSWLRKKRTLLLGAFSPNYPPFDITSGINDYGGISADYLTFITSHLNIDVSVRYYSDYQTMLEALNNGSIDLIANASWIEKENKKLLLSQPYVASIPVLVTRDDNPTVAWKNNAKIAIDKIFSNNTQLIQRYPQAQFVHYDSPRQALEELSFKQLEGVISDRTAVQYLINQANLSNLQLHPLPDKPNEGFAFATTRQNQMLITVIDKMLNLIPANIKIDILRRWSGGIPVGLSDKELQLTPLEKKWIAAHPRISVAVSQDFAPLSFFDGNGRYRGLTADLLSAISARTGLKFDVKNVGTFHNVLKSAQHGETDVAAGVTLNAVWPNGLLTTRTYLFNSWVQVGRKDNHTRPQNIALQTGHPLRNFLKNRHPDANIIAVETPRDGLNLVEQGKADAMILPLIAADFLLPRYYATTLQIVTSLDTDPARFALGVSPHAWPLVTILDKALLTIQPEDLHALTSNWYSNIQARESDRLSDTYTSFLLRNDLLTGGIIAVSLLILLLFISVHRRQKLLITELMQAREQADSANRAKTIFLATMSHEIRTPMSAIISSLELVLRRRKADASDWLALQRSYESAHSLLALIGDILDIARIESDRLMLYPERANIRQLIESTVVMFDGLAREKELSYKLEIDAEIQGDVLIDPLRFKQILSNLLSNAVKFTQQGAIVIRAVNQPGESNYLSIGIEVQDTGCGISNETLQRLFHPFAQEKGSQSGSGLGLYICQSLINMMEGEINVESQLNRGTTVSLRLTVLRLDPLPAPKMQSLSAAAETQRQLTILIAEDHPAARHLLEQQLAYLGHHTISVPDGEQALNILLDNPVDLIITDYNMPQLDGYCFIQLLRQREQKTGCDPVPVWALTAAAQPDVYENCLKVGMNDCLLKPVNLDLLAEKLFPLASQPDVTADTPVFAPHLLPAELALPETQRAFLSLLVESLNEELTLLNTWQNTPDRTFAELKALLHRIRGGIRIAGSAALSQECQQIECASLPPCETQIQTFTEHLKEFLQAVQTHLDKTAGSEDYK